MYTELYTHNINNVTNDLLFYIDIYFMLADNSLTACSTISHFFNVYCMSMYSSNLWRFNDGIIWNHRITAWRKSIRR